MSETTVHMFIPSARYAQGGEGGAAPYKALWDPRDTGRCDRLSSWLLGILPESFTVFIMSISQFGVMLTYVGLSSRAQKSAVIQSPHLPLLPQEETILKEFFFIVFSFQYSFLRGSVT